MNVNWEGLLPVQGEIIVVEDDPTLRMLMVDIVSEIGATVRQFHSADDALTYLLQAHQNCRMVIADHGVPGQIQGTEFITMVKGRWPSIEAILTSGYALDLATIPTGTVYLHKPWSLDELVISVAALLQPGHPITKT
ncbi:response regulator [Pseudomonas veronii]|uniref:Response regulator n=1 Tax=Pseudomonas veronii TaxID=76761 RepID=A0A4P7Y6Z9_PSEVE|nr:response regulator [Pseudomonas veronii]QCG66972.1 response regulator [Pseudomonas veronii]